MNERGDEKGFRGMWKVTKCGLSLAQCNLVAVGSSLSIAVFLLI